jgi:hypothetical protein
MKYNKPRFNQHIELDFDRYTWLRADSGLIMRNNIVNN